MGYSKYASKRAKPEPEKTPEPKIRQPWKRAEEESVPRGTPKKPKRGKELEIPGMPKHWDHQLITKELLNNETHVFDMSDPGTGKTRSHLEAFASRRRTGGKCCLVLAPKSLLRTAWFDDARAFVPDMLCSIAYSTNREAALDTKADIYITNLDAVKWLVKNKTKAFFKKFDTLIIDELTAFKHRTSARSKAALRISKCFDFRSGLTGTPNPNSVTDLWHQAMLIDGGERLGKQFFKFRQVMCEPTQVGPRPEHIKWEDREGSVEAVVGMLSDISVRHEFEKVMDVPPNYTRSVNFYPSNKLLNAYRKMQQEAVLQLESGEISAINAAVLRGKLLQIASGAVYDEHSDYHIIDIERYEMVLDFVEEVEHSVVFFNWAHQKEMLIRLAGIRNLSHAVIDGKVPIKKREQIVKNFQNGHYQTIFLHPQTGAHGLTLTRATRTIWSSPIYQPDFLKQGTHRIWRGGQRKKTETILIEAAGTVESIVYEMLNKKNARMVTLLDMIEAIE